MPLADLRQPQRRVGLVLPAVVPDGDQMQQRRGAQDPVPARGEVLLPQGDVGGMTPGINAFFGGEDALRLQRHYRDLRGHMAEAQRAGDRRTVADVRASMVVFEGLFCD